MQNSHIHIVGNLRTPIHVLKKESPIHIIGGCGIGGGGYQFSIEDDHILVGNLNIEDDHIIVI